VRCYGTSIVMQGAANDDNPESSSSMLLSRSLLDATTANDTATVVQISTFQELVDAIDGGYRDIEIIEHLDATSFPLITRPINGQDFKHQLPPQTSKTRSIRVRFSCPLVLGMQIAPAAMSSASPVAALLRQTGCWIQA
jgi:hypothetical protein